MKELRRLRAITVLEHAGTKEAQAKIDELISKIQQLIVLLQAEIKKMNEAKSKVTTSSSYPVVSPVQHTNY